MEPQQLAESALSLLLVHTAALVVVKHALGGRVPGVSAGSILRRKNDGIPRCGGWML